jgi:hypothetical protein
VANSGSAKPQESGGKDSCRLSNKKLHTGSYTAVATYRGGGDFTVASSTKKKIRVRA